MEEPHQRPHGEVEFAYHEILAVLAGVDVLVVHRNDDLCLPKGRGEEEYGLVRPHVPQLYRAHPLQVREDRPASRTADEGPKARSIEPFQAILCHLVDVLHERAVEFQSCPLLIFNRGNPLGLRELLRRTLMRENATLTSQLDTS